MIEYRPFLNSDPPALAEIWRSQPPSRALIQLMTPAVLDDLVFSKPFFDRHGLILAVEDDRPIGFVHAGFGPDAEFSGLDFSKGTTALLLVSPHRDQAVIAQELLARSEQYLRDRGAATLYGGATKTLAPFYFGLYGGSQLSGVLASDAFRAESFRQAGYAESIHARIFRCDLTGFRAPVDRDLMQVRRQFQLVKLSDSPPGNWWDACECAAGERVEFALTPKAGGPPAAGAKFWDVEPLATSWGARAMGLVSLDVRPGPDQAAVATHFVSEMLRQFQGIGISLVEFQLGTSDALAIEVSRKLGFVEIDQGLLFQKPAAP